MLGGVKVVFRAKDEVTRQNLPEKLLCSPSRVYFRAGKCGTALPFFTRRRFSSLSTFVLSLQSALFWTSLTPDPSTMANVVTHPHLQVGFYPGPVGHSPSPLGFGFGLSNPMMQGWPSHLQPPTSSTSAFATQQPQMITRVTKRRHEPEEEDRDERMDRSPTPERPKRAAPKRARTTPAVATAGKDPQTAKENKPPSASDESDVDVGFLLGMWSQRPRKLVALLIDHYSESSHSVALATRYSSAELATCAQVYHPLTHPETYA